MAGRGRPSKEGRVSSLVRLMALSSASPTGRTSVARAASELGVTPETVRELVYELSTIGVRDSGARLPIALDGDDILYLGTDDLLPPVRLTEDEALALSYLLQTLDISPSLRSALESALFPPAEGDTTEGNLLASNTVRGKAQALLVEACDLGIRCAISYCKPDGAKSSRTVDPIGVEERNGSSYLLAWDIEAQAERRFRMDRIETVAYTEDSAERHDASFPDVQESISQAGTSAKVVFASRSDLEVLDEAALSHVREQTDGTVSAELAVADPGWLYRRVLSSAGRVKIVSPEKLREGLVSYAGVLLGRQRRS